MKKRSGVAVPLISLRKKKGSACGEFSDLPSLASFCRKINTNIIQILPVNDSGDDPSPYGALSAFALHPIYIDITALVCAENFSKDSLCILKKEHSAILKKYAQAKRLNFRAVLADKTALLKKIYVKEQKHILENSAIRSWSKENLWVTSYALFKVLKEKHSLKSWKDWPRKFQNPSTQKLLDWENEFAAKCGFYVWLQYELFSQFGSAVQKLQAEGISLKGDLPILMNEDSVDVWLHRQLFDLHLHAGAPPDMYSSQGQNWGFPVYCWQEHKAQNYVWWKDRLRIAEKFYQYIRIDHVLGFFRIWNIPAQEIMGLSGYFSPFLFITESDLAQLGFSQARISWLSKAHVPKNEILQVDPSFSEKWITQFFEQIGNEELFLFLPQIREKDILQARLAPKVQEALLKWYHNHALLSLAEGLYFPHWYLHDSRAFVSLHDIEKEVFLELVKSCYKKSEQVWEKDGKEILSQLKKSSKLFFCAEDLGVVPSCVPKVMKELFIFGLRIERWSRHYQSDSSFFLPSDYPEQSVVTVSVHDTSTLRDWWQNESEDSRAFYKSFCEDEEAQSKKQTNEKNTKQSEEQDKQNQNEPYENPKSFALRLEPSLHFQILRRHVERGNSGIVIFQIQELIDLGHSLRSNDPRQDRINVPGTANDFNWSYRLPASIEELAQEKNWLQTLQKLFK